ncbi:MAG: hypothetical protein ACRCY9_16580 [Phycicoccus sp.]
MLILSSRAGRRTARSLLAILWGRLLAIFVLYAGYIVGVVLLARLVGLWRTNMLGETVAWFLLSGLVLFGRFTAVAKDRWFFRNSLRALVQVGALVAVFASAVTFNLLAEVILALVLTALAVIKAVADAEEALQPIRSVLTWTLALVGLGVGAATVWSVLHSWNELDKAAIALSLGMAIWLPAAVLPMVVSIGTFAAYETAFGHMQSMSGDSNQWLTRGALASQLLVRPHLVGGFSHPWQWELRQAGSWGGARAVVRRYRQAHTRSLEALLKRESRALKRTARGRQCLDTSSRRDVAEGRAPLLETVQARPPGWELILFGRVLAHLLRHVQSWETLRDRNPSATSGFVRSRAVAMKVLTRYPTLASEAMDDFASTFAINRQEEAFGAPGEAGDPVRIVKLAEEVIQFYARLRDLGQGLSDVRMDGDLLNVREALRALTDEPAVQIRTFVGDTFQRTERLPALLAKGGPVELVMRTELTVSDEAQAAVEDAFSELSSAAGAAEESGEV